MHKQSQILTYCKVIEWLRCWNQHHNFETGLTSCLLRKDSNGIPEPQTLEKKIELSNVCAS